jgi:hypothetical protein
MNKLVYIYVANEFVINQVVLKLLSKRLAVAMANKTVVRKYWFSQFLLRLNLARLRNTRVGHSTPW